MKTGIRIGLLVLITLYSCSTSDPESDYTGVEYIKLKRELASGWNTWNTKSVLSHVLMPEAVSVDFYLRDNQTGRILKEALIGRRGEDAETVIPVAHSYDGSYTELIIKWKGIEMMVQSCAEGNNICFLLTPLGEIKDGDVLISPNEMWWDRDGKVQTGNNRLIYDLPSGEMNIYIKGKISSSAESDLSFIAYDASEEIILSTEKDFDVSDVKVKIASARSLNESNKNKYGDESELYHAMQNALAWNVIFEPDEQRVITTVNRIWNMYRGGYVIFCWDTYFAAHMHSLDNKALAYANAIEMTNAITASGFVPNLSASKGIKTRDRSQPPVGSFTVLEIYKRYGEKWFLHEVFQKLLTWNRWWKNNRDSDGYLCWGSSEFEPYLRNFDKNAHSRYGAALESGLDNSPMYDDVPFDPETNQIRLADVGLMSMYVMDCEALAEIAAILGKNKIKAELENRANYYRDNLNKLWVEEEGIYLNKRLDTDEFSSKISPTNFYPMLAKAPSEEQVKRMIEEHLYNPDEFWGEYALPSMAYNDPSYKANDYWRGRVWGPMNFLVYLGLKNYNVETAQKDLAKKSKDLFLEQWLENGYVCENYNSQTGECDDVNRCELFYHWGGLLGFISLIDEGYMDDNEN